MAGGNMAELRTQEQAISQAASLCMNQHAEQQGNLASFAATAASLRANWESQKPTQIFDQCTAELRDSATRQQATVERMNELLRRYGAQVSEGVDADTRGVTQVAGLVGDLRAGLKG
jgi:hypothetical protein